jgi:hypothetical protein
MERQECVRQFYPVSFPSFTRVIWIELESVQRIFLQSRLGGEEVPQPEKKKAELKVAGMDALTCAITIEDALKEIPEVGGAQVNLGTDSVKVESIPPGFP